MFFFPTCLFFWLPHIGWNVEFFPSDLEVSGLTIALEKFKCLINMQLLEGKRKRKYTITFFLFDREESPVVQNAQKWVSSRDLDSLPVPVPSVISSQCLISEPPCLPPAIMSCFSFPFTYFPICWGGERLWAGTIQPKKYLCQLAKHLPCDPFALSGKERHLRMIQIWSGINHSS